MSNIRIGFIGLGNMGFHMASRLAQQEYPLVIYDINKAVLQSFEADDVIIANCPEDVANHAEIVCVSLPTPSVVKEVALGEKGLIHGTRMQVYIDLSTSGPDAAYEVGKAFLDKGIEVLDCPVSGGVTGAAKGTLSLMVAGSLQTYEKQLSLLQQFGKKIFHVGNELGQAQLMKVINNLLSSSALAMTSEAVVLGRKAGLDPKTMIDVLNASSGRNSATEDKFYNSILTRTFDFGFDMSLAYKDIKLCLEIAEKLEVPMFIGSNMVHFWRYVMSQSSEDEKDFTNVIKHIEKWANVTV
jgi:3-hydroxyisobutyrate dehydrogenase-like beta-hydroxyacid dehydrogenase